MKDYIVYWNGTETGYDKIEDALAFAKECTREEKEFDTALIINRKYSLGVKMYTLRWIIFGMYEYTEVQI